MKEWPFQSLAGVSLSLSLYVHALHMFFQRVHFFFKPFFSYHLGEFEVFFSWEHTNKLHWIGAKRTFHAYLMMCSVAHIDNFTRQRNLHSTSVDATQENWIKNQMPYFLFRFIQFLFILSFITSLPRWLLLVFYVDIVVATNAPYELPNCCMAAYIFNRFLCVCGTKSPMQEFN